jgi:UDP-N-acetylglucosamine diphosphorylase / glucose-1-phosphate thymidylyltransferase / UDP-N-acetylgalactosamine diphosphorylase / glucosamine-1-phosphate N-acetyltransferase / galactosamine-1-phosphate N-acetyltransferase
MNRIIFTEEWGHTNLLYPFTLTRRVADLRVGILTLREKWERLLGWPSFDQQKNDYLDTHACVSLPDFFEGQSLVLHAHVLPNQPLIDAIRSLEPGMQLVHPEFGPIAHLMDQNTPISPASQQAICLFTETVASLMYPWDMVQYNDSQIRFDYACLTQGRSSATISQTNRILGEAAVFLEAGVSMECCIINATTGPVYIGKDATVMEGSMIRGPFALGAGSVVKMGATIYGATSVGPSCIVGGEIKNTIFQAFSNKAHGGYLGDAVIGAWCNLGAGATCSNVKNNAGDIYVYHQGKGEGVVAGRKCGLMMGDYARAAIQTAFNTGTVVGVCANVFGAGLTPAYIPHFAWGSLGSQRYDFEKSLRDIDVWMQWKNRQMNDQEKIILKYIYENF